MNTDGLCRSCLQGIRAEEDIAWALGSEEGRPRAVQLVIGAYRDHALAARPLQRGAGGGLLRGDKWRRKWGQQQRAAAPAARVLEPVMRGQIPLFTVARTLTGATVRAIADRPVAGWEAARQAVAELAVEHRLSRGWRYRVGEMVRLALAVREAEGSDLLAETLLQNLPAKGDAVRAVLLRAGLLSAAPQPLRFHPTDQPSTPYIDIPAPRPPLVPRQCRDCHAWMPGGQPGYRCKPCRHWRGKYDRGPCVRCCRPDLPLRAGHCRACHPYCCTNPDRSAASRATQLQIALPVGRPRPRREPLGDGGPVVPQAGRGQEPLFTLRRDWQMVLDRLGRWTVDDLPLTAAARRLVGEFNQLIVERRSPDYSKNIRTLTILVYWLGAEAAIWERDVRDLAACSPRLAAKPVCQFLHHRGLLTVDPGCHRDVSQVKLQAAISALPQPLADEINVWVTFLRSRGRHEGEVRTYGSIRSYFALAEPALTQWMTAGVTTLRAITADHVEAALAVLSATARHSATVALRSLFKVLKRQRVIFRDPTRHLFVGKQQTLPEPVPSDLLAGLLYQASTPRDRLIVALTAIHALPGEEVRTLLTRDLSLARGTLEVRRGALRHTLYLEELTHLLATEWLAYRHHRWPASTNPHLLISQKTAPDLDQPAVSRSLLRKALPQQVTLGRLRQDRILNEAFATGDPLRLMRLFGITEQTAMRYMAAASPERTARLPR